MNIDKKHKKSIINYSNFHILKINLIKIKNVLYSKFVRIRYNGSLRYLKILKNWTTTTSNDPKVYLFFSIIVSNDCHLMYMHINTPAKKVKEHRGNSIFIKIVLYLGCLSYLTRKNVFRISTANFIFKRYFRILENWCILDLQCSLFRLFVNY